MNRLDMESYTSRIPEVIIRIMCANVGASSKQASRNNTTALLFLPRLTIMLSNSIRQAVLGQIGAALSSNPALFPPSLRSLDMRGSPQDCAGIYYTQLGLLLAC